MTKGKSKRSSGANEVGADGGVKVSEPQTSADAPQLDENAFAGLRQKIEQRLKNENSGKDKSKKDNKNKASTGNARSEKEKGAATKTGKGKEAAQGKKRDRNGDVIAREQEDDKTNKQTKPESSKKDNRDDTLRQEILALGGTEEDLDLLADVDSESEVEGTASKGKKGGDDDLRKELSKMLEAAGHVVPDDLEDEPQESEEAEAEADEDSEGDSEGTSEPEDVSEVSDIEEAPHSKSKEPEPVVPKEYAKLVSGIKFPLNKAVLTLVSTGHRPSVRLV